MKNCLECGYPLSGKRTGRCPECGKPIQVDIDLSLPLERSPRRIIFSFAIRMTAAGVSDRAGHTFCDGEFRAIPGWFLRIRSGGLRSLDHEQFPDHRPHGRIPSRSRTGSAPRDTIRLATRWGSFSWLVLASGSSLIASGLLPATIIGATLRISVGTDRSPLPLPALPALLPAWIASGTGCETKSPAA